MTVLVNFLSVFKDSIPFILFYVLADQASCALSSISQHQFVPTKTQSHQREWLEIWYAVGLYAWLSWCTPSFLFTGCDVFFLI